MKTRLVFLALLSFASFTQAATFTVTTTADSGAGSLRQAILNANALGGGTIIFSGVTGKIDLLSPLPAIVGNLEIAGPGAAAVLVNYTNGVDAALKIASGATSTVSGLTITGWRTNISSCGGGVSSAGTLTLSNCVVSNCRASQGGGICNSGALVLYSCVVSNNSAHDSPGGGIYSSGSLTLRSCLISGNSTAASGANGGGVAGSLTASDCSFSGNYSDSSGGAIYGASVVLTDCSVANNFADNGGGGVAATTLALTNCSVRGNQATTAGGISGSGALLNTTVSGNRAEQWGGVYGQTITLLSSTVCSNRATSIAGGVSGNTIYSRNSIIAGNSAATGPDISGTLTSQGFNLIQNTNGCTIVGTTTGNLLGVNPRLGPLQNNGGPTWTHALLSGSPAIDAGGSTGAPSTDQRGVPRPQGAGVDIGAVEVVTAAPLFVRPLRLQPSGFSLNIIYDSTNACRIQASTNVVVWIDLTNYPLGGCWWFLDTSASNFPRRFYRCKVQ
jgi:predicted outer membrane repeat protein